MKNKQNEQKEINTNWLTTGKIIIKAIPYIISVFAIVISYITRDEVSRYNSMTQAQIDLVRNLYETENYYNNLVDKYGLSKEPDNTIGKIMFSKISLAEKNKLNEYHMQGSCLLEQLFVVMPDDKYQFIKEIGSGQHNRRELRYNLLLKWRKMNYPKTKYANSNDIYSIEALP